MSPLQKKLVSSMITTSSMNGNLHRRQLEDPPSHNAGGNGYENFELKKMNPLGELSFFFGERSAASNSQQQRLQHQQQQQNSHQQPGKRSMDDVLKKLSSKMQISHSPNDETDPFTIERSVFIRFISCILNPPTERKFPNVHRQSIGTHKSTEISELYSVYIETSQSG